MARVSPSAYYNWRKHYIRYVFFYGSLRRGQKGYIELELDKYLRYYAEDRVPGKLYDLGEYPGMKPAKAAVPTAIKGELYWINDEEPPCAGRVRALRAQGEVSLSPEDCDDHETYAEGLGIFV